jgi:hypothetical protein
MLTPVFYVAQRLAAQPLGRFRHLVTILAGNLKSQFSVLSLSLGQVGCSRVLGGYITLIIMKSNYLLFCNPLTRE